MRIKRLFSNYYWDFNEVKNILENLKIKFGGKRPTHPGARETRKAMEGWSLTWLPGNLNFFTDISTNFASCSQGRSVYSKEGLNLLHLL